MKGIESDIIRLNHILDAIAFIEQFSEHKSKAELFNDHQFRFAVERQLEIIGEAARNLSDLLRTQHSAINWPETISFRNFLANEYFGIDLELVWDVLENHLPKLKAEAMDILAALQ